MEDWSVELGHGNDDAANTIPVTMVSYTPVAFDACYGVVAIVETNRAKCGVHDAAAGEPPPNYLAFRLLILLGPCECRGGLHNNACQLREVP